MYQKMVTDLITASHSHAIFFLKALGAIDIDTAHAHT